MKLLEYANNIQRTKSKMRFQNKHKPLLIAAALTRVETVTDFPLKTLFAFIFLAISTAFASGGRFRFFPFPPSCR